MQGTLINLATQVYSCKIPFPIKISRIFPNPAPYFGHIPDPENTLPDPELKVKFKRNL